VKIDSRSLKNGFVASFHSFQTNWKILALTIDLETVKIDLRGLKTVFVVGHYSFQISWKTLVVKIDL